MAAGSESWPLERIPFALARDSGLGDASRLLASRWSVLLAGLVGLNQWLYVGTPSCPASLMLRRGCRRQSVMYVDDDRADARVKEVTV
jgi:hypothetical protein